MASSKIYNPYYIKASSLIESTIAITIITISLLIALKLYITIIDHSISLKTGKVQYEIDKLFIETKLSNSYDTEVYIYKNYNIRKEVDNYKNTENLLKLSFFVETKLDTTSFHYLVDYEGN